MAVNPLSPGVYIDEISVFPPSVAGVATAIPAFIGHTQQRIINGSTIPVNTPVRISAFTEFQAIFGGAYPENFSYSILDQINSAAPSVVLNRTVTATLASISEYKLYHSVRHYFDNGGGPCYIVSVGSYSDSVIPGTATTGLEGGLNAIGKEDEPTLLLFPDQLTSPSVGQTEDYKAVYDKALAQCNRLQDRFVIMDIKTQGTVPLTDANTFRDSGIGSNYLKYGAVYYPFLKTVYAYGYKGSNLVSHTRVDQTGTTSNGPLNNIVLEDPNLLTTQVRILDPNAYNLILLQINKVTVNLAPSGAMAGIYASVDRDRGVWKAPANISVASITGPVINVTTSQQDNLNIDATSGKSINAIRAFTGKGTIVWGARTLAGNDNEWRYVNVRRLFNFAEESIKKATEFVVFEGNDANTWVRVKSLITNFLTNLWRDGGLVGAKTDQAFFVKVGLNETMTAQDILEGKLIVEIGLAASRPAEFIILRVMHKLQES